MDILKHIFDFQSYAVSPYTYAGVATFFAYKHLSKKIGAFIREQLEGLKGAMQVQSVTLDGHTKKFEEVDKTLNNHETRIGVLEKPKP